MKLVLPTHTNTKYKNMVGLVYSVRHPSQTSASGENVFGVSIDYIVNGTIHNKAEKIIDDDLLLKQFKAVEQMNKDDKNIISKLIEAFITKKQIQKIIA